MNDPRMLASRFPGDFTFGVATASFQIEGATREDGRKPSIWDAFSNMPGRVFGRHNGDVACDHYHRLKEDLDLVKAMGVSAYRFSIACRGSFPTAWGASTRRASISTTGSSTAARNVASRPSRPSTIGTCHWH